MFHSKGVLPTVTRLIPRQKLLCGFVKLVKKKVKKIKLVVERVGVIPDSHFTENVMADASYRRKWSFVGFVAWQKVRLLRCWWGVAVKEANGTFTVDDDIIIIWGWGSWLVEAAHLLGTRMEEYRRFYVLIKGWCGKERYAVSAMSYYSATTNESNVPQAKPWWVSGDWDLRVRYVSSHRCSLTMERGRKWGVHCYIWIKEVEIWLVSICSCVQ